MTTTTFDTHEVYRHIKAAGLTEQQTDSLFEAVKVAHSSSELATKGDIKEVEYKVELLRAETAKSIAELKTELIKWIIGVSASIAIAQTGFLMWFIQNHSKI